jgi:membrane-associated phospholipid phosphatase
MLSEMINRILKLPLYLKLNALFFAALLFICTAYTKTAGFVLLNLYHKPWLDRVFRVLTHLGDGCFALAVIAVCFLMRQRRLGYSLTLAFLSSGLVAVLLKILFREDRPKLYFEKTGFRYPYFIEGMVTNNSCSFPSGHTTTAFAIATVLSLWSGKNNMVILLFFLAAVAGYSRIYLAQHFPQDVLAGMVIGMMAGMLSHHLVLKKAVYGQTRPQTKYNLIS